MLQMAGAKARDPNRWRHLAPGAEVMYSRREFWCQIEPIRVFFMLLVFSDVPRAEPVTH